MLDFGYYNMDCMEGMKEFPDKYFDLAIVDPPYGGGSDDYDATSQRYGGVFDKYFKNIKVERMGGRTERYNIKAERTGGAWASK